MTQDEHQWNARHESSSTERRVTQENLGKRTAGYDGQTATTPEARVALVKQMLEYTLWQAHPVKRVYIPKSGGKLALV